MIEIKTDRLTLRPPHVSDAAALTLYLSDPAVAGNLARVPKDYSLTHAENWLNNLPENTHPANAKFTIAAKTDQLAGMIGFSEKNDTAELAYWLGPPYWGGGLMSEAAIAIINWYFSTTDAKTLRAGAYHFNTASLAIQRKLGFVETGRAPMYCLAQDKDIENIETELNRAAFYARIPN